MTDFISKATPPSSQRPTPAPQPTAVVEQPTIETTTPPVEAPAGPLTFKTEIVGTFLKALLIHVEAAEVKTATEIIESIKVFFELPDNKKELACKIMAMMIRGGPFGFAAKKFANDKLENGTSLSAKDLLHIDTIHFRNVSAVIAVAMGKTGGYSDFHLMVKLRCRGWKTSSRTPLSSWDIQIKEPVNGIFQRSPMDR